MLNFHLTNIFHRIDDTTNNLNVNASDNYEGRTRSVKVKYHWKIGWQ